MSFQNCVFLLVVCAAPPEQLQPGMAVESQQLLPGWKEVCDPPKEFLPSLKLCTSSQLLAAVCTLNQHFSLRQVTLEKQKQQWRVRTGVMVLECRRLQRFVAFFSAARVQERSGYWQEVHKVLLGWMDFASCFPWVGSMLFLKSYTSSENFCNAKWYCPTLYNVELKHHRCRVVLGIVCWRPD